MANFLAVETGYSFLNRDRRSGKELVEDFLNPSQYLQDTFGAGGHLHPCVEGGRRGAKFRHRSDPYFSSLLSPSWLLVCSQFLAGFISYLLLYHKLPPKLANIYFPFKATNTYFLRG